MEPNKVLNDEIDAMKEKMVLKNEGMDINPDNTLHSIMGAVENILYYKDNDIDDLIRLEKMSIGLAQNIKELDRYLSKGGNLPKIWMGPGVSQSDTDEDDYYMTEFVGQRLRARYDRLKKGTEDDKKTAKHVLMAYNMLQLCYPEFG